MFILPHLAWKHMTHTDRAMCDCDVCLSPCVFSQISKRPETVNNVDRLLI